MKKIIINAIVLTIALSCFSQNGNPVQDSLKILYDEEAKSLIFPDGSEIKVGFNFYSFSPNKMIVAILDFNKGFRETARLKIFNHNSELREFDVHPLDKVQVFNDGRFIIYGSTYEQGMHVVISQSIYFYNSNGVPLVDEKNKYTTGLKFKIEPNTGVLLLIGELFSPEDENKTVVVKLYDEKFTSRLIKTFDNWPRDARFPKILSYHNEEVKLSRVNDTNGDNITETIKITVSKNAKNDVLWKRK